MAEELATETAKKSPPKIGCGTMIAIALISFILLGIGLNEAAGYYFSHCADQDLFACFFRQVDESEHTGVTAKGTYTYNDYAADITLYIPLDGGNVTGNVNGTCTGTATGSFDGKDNGIITGTMTGYCDPFFIKIPARGSFNGTVQKEAKKVPLSIEGSGGGFDKEDSMELIY